MVTRKLTDLEIKVRIVPRRVRWPEAHFGRPWTEAHNCVHALETLVRDIDFACLQAEQDRKLLAGAIRDRRAKICDQALRRLEAFSPFEVAERALTENIEALERQDARDPEEVRRLHMLERGLRDLREGIAATRRMVLERCKVQQRVYV